MARVRRFFPERIRRRDVLLSAMIDDYLTRMEGKLRTNRDAERYGRMWKAALGSKALRSIVPGDVERYVAKRRSGEPTPAKNSRSEKARKAGVPLPSTINRELAFLRRVFNVAIADGLADSNAVRPRLFAREK